MADFKAGDRVVKMSGFSAGKYGTVNSVLENGTLNVTFDGERLPKYCDPMRCGQVSANAVEFTNPNYRPEAGMRFLDENFSMFDPKVAKAMIEDARRKGVKVPPGVIEKARRAGLIANAARNAVARNAADALWDRNGKRIKVGDTLDTPKGMAEVVDVKWRTGSDFIGRKADYVGVTYTPGGRRVDEWLMCDVHGIILRATVANSAKGGAVARNGVPWTGEEKRALGSAYHPNGGFVRWGRQSVEFIHSGFGKYFVYKDGDGRYSVSFTPADPYEKGWMKRASSIDEANRIMGTW